MKFGPCPVDEAAGSILAHSTTAGGLRLRKAHVLTVEDVAALKAAGIESIVVARLAPGDVNENAAATRIAQALRIENAEIRAANTGRTNFHAACAGLLVVNKTLIDALNAIDPAITIATLADYSPVEQGQMVGTVKIIPYAVSGAQVESAEVQAVKAEAFAVHPFTACKVGLVQTRLAATKPSVLDKTADMTAARLARSQSRIIGELRTPHDTAAVAAAIDRLAPECDALILFGASAVSDENDVIPAAIRAAGGSVERTGMPVDPGNLLVLGRLGKKWVLGAPGCARSPKANGFDWVLDRLTAGLRVTSQDIAGMGVGGLLTEIPSRPQPREARRSRDPVVGAVLLAAGRSSRMGAQNKLLAHFGGEALVRRVAERLAESGVGETVAVVGHQPAKIRAALDGIAVRIAENSEYNSGIASSLKVGVHALSARADGAMIVLGDMPDVSSGNMKQLITAFRDHHGRAIIRATAGGRRGNPVILPRALFGEVDALQGDTGARHIIDNSDLEIIDIELGDAARVDVDTPDALAAAGGIIQE